MTLKNKKILIIVGGGIAAYKSLDLIRLLRKENVEVKTILTKSGKEFVTPLSLTTLTKSKAYEDIFDKNSEAEIDHIALSRWADLIIVMPTTANFMSKLSVGKAEDLATTVLLASNKDILLVPAMNVRMWLHKATQVNNKILQDFGYLFIGPEKGEMACGEFGEGKMSSPRQIFSEVKNFFYNKDYIKNKKLKALVTAGPTRTEECIVTFDKGKLGLGLDQDSDGFTGAMISSVAPGGKAEQTGNVHIGDLLVEVNGTHVAALEFGQIMEEIKKVGRPLTLKLKPRPWITEIFKAEAQVIQHVIKPAYNPNAPKARAPSSPMSPLAKGLGLKNPKSRFLKFGKMGFTDMVKSAQQVDAFMKHADMHSKTKRVHEISTEKRKIAARKKLEKRIARRMGIADPSGGKAAKTHASL